MTLDGQENLGIVGHMKFLTPVIFAVAALLFNSCASGPSAKEVVPVVTKTKSKPRLELERDVISTQYGISSWYSIKTNYGTKTASGRRLFDNAYTAAHKTLPMGSKVRVTCLFNGKSEILTINDRGPYTKGRIIDVTIGSAKRLGFYSRGITKVKVEVLSRGKWRYKH